MAYWVNVSESSGPGSPGLSQIKAVPAHPGCHR